MNTLMLLFWLLLAGTLQVVCPPWQHMGQPPYPFLLVVVLYAAMHKRPRYFIFTAILAGIVEDALSLSPLGTSACAYLAAGTLAYFLRGGVMDDAAPTVFWRGALCAAFSTAVMALMLRLHGLLPLPPSGVFLRMTGAALIGAFLSPIQFWLMDRMEGLLGTRTTYWERMEGAYH